MKVGARVVTSRTYERSALTGVWTATAHTPDGKLTVEGDSMEEARIALDRLLDPTAPRDDFERLEEVY
jgi:hypothetical protein